MRRLISTVVLVLAACAGAGKGAQGIDADSQFMQTLATLTQLDLFDRAAVERELHASLQAYEQLTVPPRIAYRSVDSAMVPFTEATYETRNKQSWTTLTLWLDDVHCYSTKMIGEKYDFLSSKFEMVDPEQEKRGVDVALSYPGHKNRLLIGYRKATGGGYCAKNIVINGQREL